MEDHHAGLTLSVQDGDSGGALIDQGFVSLMPLFCSSSLRARVNVVLEMLLATGPFSAVLVLTPLLLPLELDWSFAPVGYSRKTWDYNRKGSKNALRSEWQETIFNVSGAVLIRLIKWKIFAILRVP